MTDDELDRAGTLVLPEGMRLELLDANAAARTMYGEDGCRKMWPDRDMTVPDWRVHLAWDLPLTPGELKGSASGPSDPALGILARAAIERGAKMYGQA